MSHIRNFEIRWSSSPARGKTNSFIYKRYRTFHFCSSYLNLPIKHTYIKFEYKFDCKQIVFLDTLVYIDQQNKLHTLFRKSSDRQNFLNAKSEHSYSLKKSIPCSQALQIRRKCSTLQDFHSHSRKLINYLLIKDTKRRCHTANSERRPTRLKTTAPLTWNKSLALIPSITTKNL